MAMYLQKSIVETSLELPGWYGKLPTLGDFASRRLAVGFIETWDDWLAHGMAAWRAGAPGEWLDEYLAGPTWKFVLMPGVLPGPPGATAWAGVLMPSIDRVGRHFPFTVAQPLPTLPDDGHDTETLLRWLHGLEDLAVDALHDDWSVEQLEAALKAIGRWSAGPASHDNADAPGAGIDLSTQARGRSLWLVAGADGRTELFAEAGLPAGPAFRRLLAGRPQARADLMSTSPGNP